MHSGHHLERVYVQKSFQHGDEEKASSLVQDPCILVQAMVHALKIQHTMTNIVDFFRGK